MEHPAGVPDDPADILERLALVRANQRLPVAPVLEHSHQRLLSAGAPEQPAFAVIADQRARGETLAEYSLVAIAAQLMNPAAHAEREARRAPVVGERSHRSVGLMDEHRIVARGHDLFQLGLLFRPLQHWRSNSASRTAAAIRPCGFVSKPSPRLAHRIQLLKRRRCTAPLLLPRRASCGPAQRAAGRWPHC